ncbi:hypothetical protein P7K49_002362 [Saguinus oedipus]|uniref:Uncharacterized protein n=1 Tax=Saguinus oedipus TaxID=9490 RepID=A0ABQ9WH45_SAGOE|nr:hypothetical protein P7K49_002362 [Saguinus oedipus]
MVAWGEEDGLGLSPVENKSLACAIGLRGRSRSCPSHPCPVCWQVVADSCRQGYLDALRFLERRGLTKEPVLWTLTSKESPAPADRGWDAGCDQHRKGGLSLNWKVPHVQVKDVPNFEQLSPELEAGPCTQGPGVRDPALKALVKVKGTVSHCVGWGAQAASPRTPALKKACKRDRSPWARFCRSGPGQVLTYLLLPCTLPFEYVYYRSRSVSCSFILPAVAEDLSAATAAALTQTQLLASWSSQPTNYHTLTCTALQGYGSADRLMLSSVLGQDAVLRTLNVPSWLQPALQLWPTLLALLSPPPGSPEVQGPGSALGLWGGLVAWLPDVPADLWWMQGLLRSVAHKVYSRTKAQLLGPIR